MAKVMTPDTAQTLSLTYRKRANLTQRQLARLLTCSPGRVGEIERGIVRSWRVVERLKDLANMDRME